MIPSNYSISTILSGEFWELKSKPELYEEFLSDLQSCYVKIINSEISCSFNIEAPQAIIEEAQLCIPESGLNINFDEVGCCLLKSSECDSGKMQLVFTSKEKNEQIIFEIESKEENALKTLSKYLLKSHDHLPERGKVNDCRRALCPCCKEKRQNTRSDISSHPLYHIISFACFVDQPIWLSFNREMVSFTKAFSPSKECHPEGIVSFKGKDSVLALDVGEIFHCIAHGSSFEGENSTVVQCYNSHGKPLFRLIQQNTELYDVWGLITEKEYEK